LLQHTNWTSIRRERLNGDRTQTQYDGEGKGTTWSVWYRYSAQEQWEQFNHNLRRQRALKQHDKEYVKEQRVRPKHWKKAPRRREYKPPSVEESAITVKATDILFDETVQREYAQFDLGRNEWITAFSTRFQWNHYRKEIVHEIGEYKLYVSVDDEDRDRRLFGLDKADEIRNRQRVRVRVNAKERGFGATKSMTMTTRRRRKREQNERAKERKWKKLRDKLKWEYVGCFDGSMKGFWFDDSADFGVDKVHRVNHTVYCDHRSAESMKKHFAKNGKLGRWIKVVPCDRNEDLKNLKAQVYGVSVDRYSQPVIAGKDDQRDGLDLDEDLDGYTAADDGYTLSDDDDDDSDFGVDRVDGVRAKNLQIGPRVQNEEIEEGKGCRLVLFEQRPVLEFHREIDGVLPGYYSPDWIHGDTIEKRRQFRKSVQCTKKYHEGLSVNDWDINGVPRF